MKQWELAELLNDLPDDIISAAYTPTSKTRRVVNLVCASAACLTAVIAVAVYMYGSTAPPERIAEPVVTSGTVRSDSTESAKTTTLPAVQSDIAETAFPAFSAQLTAQTTFDSLTAETAPAVYSITTETKATVTTVASASDELWSEPQWNERTIEQQFVSFQHDGAEYVTRTARIPDDQVGAYLYPAVLTGQDYASGALHTANAGVYRIQGISPDCAVAVRFEGYDGYYSYTNRAYFPSALGELMDSLSLTETLSFGTVYRPDGAALDTYDAAVLKQLLTDCRSIKRTDDQEARKVLFQVSVSVGLLGIENKSMQFTEDGYLHTNLMEWGYSFYIGTETVQDIANAIGIENAVSSPTTETEDVVEE